MCKDEKEFRGSKIIHCRLQSRHSKRLKYKVATND